jgi:DNA-directed RNA polymerase subunit F
VVARKVTLTLGVAAATLGAAGCKHPAADNAPPPEAAAAAAGLTPEQAGQVLARVGEHAITLGDYAAALEHMSRFDRMRYQAPERRRELLEEMIEVELLADEARERGYDKDPVVEQEVREVLRDAYFAKVREAAPTPAEISAQDVRAYYEAHQGDFHDPERRRVSAIVLPSAAAAGPVLDAAKVATPTQWGDLVKAKSTDPEARANVPADLAGDFGFTSPPGDERGSNSRIPAEVRSAVFEAHAVGDVVPRAIASGGKYYVVKFASKSDAHDRSLADAERTIRVKLAQDALVAKESSMIDELRKQYPVQVDETALAKVAAGVSLDASAAD